jgi:tripartite-type tricarboxylate transporter receptor subunit TctC
MFRCDNRRLVFPYPVHKLHDVFKKVAEGPEFQKVLEQVNMPYDYKSGAELDQEPG